MSIRPSKITALRKKARRGNRGYPLATVAFYGPDNQRASKVAVGIVRGADQQPSELRRWFSDTTYIRCDENVAAEMVEFVRASGAASVAMADRIVGCPHEEGVDYPEGKNCPKCPFWAGRDRWSGEIEH
jgi:hypothetical protein